MNHTQFSSRILFTLVALAITGCSLNYDRGKKLEAEERWEESAIEYRKAFVEKPESVEIQEALARVNQKIAAESLVRYREYIKQKKFEKAYQRLHAALIHNPELMRVREELHNWTRVLLTGKVELEFESLGKNLRLAEEMQLKVRLNTPSGKTISGTISNDTGIFFTEHLVYRHTPEQLAQYSLNSIGLGLRQKTSMGFIRHEFDKFINFRKLAPGNVEGRLLNMPDSLRSVYDHRSTLKDMRQNPGMPWTPPRLVKYSLILSGDVIRVISQSKRREFAPDVLYMNQKQFRAFVEFGIYQLKLGDNIQRWSISRKTIEDKTDDYFPDLSRNMALNRYFFFDKVYRYDL